MASKTKDVFEKELRLLIWELRDNPYRRFLVAFLLIWAIPFLTIVYLVMHSIDGPSQLSIDSIWLILLLLFVISVGGGLLALRMLNNILDKLVAYFIRAKRQDELKSRFVATISHELKSPLMALQTNFSNLSAGFAGPITENQQAIVETCQSVIDRMDQLIVGVLDLYKIESGMIALNLTDCDAAHLLHAQQSEMSSLFAQKGIEVSSKIPQSAFPVRWDGPKMSIVFNNLLSNALKYTPEKGRVSTQLESLDDFLKFEIQNTGEQIPKEHLETIFARFEKLHPEAEGYGLGLAISRDIIEAHGGRIWAESRPQKNCFIIYVPKEAGKTNG
jgi:signal transduction histidine kinase